MNTTPTQSEQGPALIHALAVNSAASQAFDALNRLRFAAWKTGRDGKSESVDEDKASAALTAAIAELQKLAHGIEGDR